MPQDPALPPQTQFRFAEIDVNLAPSDEKITALFRIDSEQRGKKGPALVILAEISSTLYVYEQLLDTISQAAEQTRSLLSAVDTDCVVRFEKIVQKLNEAVSAFVAQEPTPITWNRVNIYVIEFSDHFMCLTGIGRMSSMFLQKQKDGQMRGFDLFGSLEQLAEVNPEKVFSSLICGDMNPGDILFAGTLNFERLRQELQIKERLINLPPVTACLEIRQDLERHHIPDQFCAMVVTHVARTTATAIPVLEAEPEATEPEPDSIQKLHEEAMKTESILAPTTTPLQDLPTPMARLKANFANFSATARSKAEELRTPRKRAPLSRDPLTLTSLRGMNAGHGSLFTDERKKKLVALAAVVVIVLGGGAWLYHARQFAAEQELWNTSLNQAIDRKNRAEADLIYNNEDGARGLLKEATMLVTPLDENTADRKTAKAKFLADLREVQKKLQRETRIEQPTELLALTDTSHGLRTLSFAKGELFTVDPAGNALVEISPTTKEAKRLALPPETPKVLATAANNNAVVLFTEEHIALLADPVKGNVGIIPFTFTNASSVHSVAAYNGRLYALDPAKGMIWRYSASGNTSYGQEKAYLAASDPSLSDATSIAIDSNVYVGFQNGQVKRFLSGKESPWSFRGVDPALTNISAIWTSVDSDRILFLDRTGKRIIVVNKEGQLISQITSPAFDDLRDLTADPATKKIFVTSGSHLYQVDLP